MANLTSYFRRFDWLVFGSSALLAVLGLAVLYGTSLGSGETAVDLRLFWRQFWFVAVGLSVSVIVPAVDYRLMTGVAKAMYVAAGILLVAVLAFGNTVRGTTGWFGLFGFGIQPVELVKFLLIVFLAKYFADYARDRSAWRPIVGSGLAFAAIFLLVIMQPDMGSALLLFAVWAAMLVMSGIRRAHLLALIGIFAACGAIAWMFVLAPYQKDRFTAFLDPSFEPQGKGYNVTQSMIAIGSGGLFGKGLGYGSQSQLRFLPERQTDFIFASVAEEMGMLGVVFMLGLFGTLFYRCYRLSVGARDDFTLFLVLGISASLAAELVINIGGAVRLLPLTGVTLPFVSYGGSSVLAKFLMVGVLQSVAVRQRG
ncbi:rod shape-determining protein RodA [Candidatus Uhrbacteria bacterium]|nr:rod shape-determining protein RodA [Candidatus Uhrbacteria bacterium]